MTQKFSVLFIVSFLSLLVNGQSVISQEKTNLIDLTDQIRTLKQKANNLYPDNFLAVPVLDKKKSSTRLTFTSSEKNSKEAHLVLGQTTETYVLFKDVVMQLQDELTAYSSYGLWDAKVYRFEDVKDSGRLMIGPFSGDITLSTTGSFESLDIQQVYTSPVNEVALNLGFGSSFNCHRNINCDEGESLVDVKRSVMRIRMVAEEGVALCTGTLLNNTGGDRTPYVLTAYHCLRPPEGTITPLFDMWFFDFNYESFSCANPEEEPFPFEIQGAERLSEWEDTDMMLLRITQDIPMDANVHYAGWNRDPNHLPDSTFLIHHPLGDIKKLSIDIDSAKVHDRRIGWNNGANSPQFSHIINDFDESTYEPGSSGAPIFDTEGRVLGQLHGGPVSDEFCSIGIGYSGRLSLSWTTGDDETTRLSDWLDPLGIGLDAVDGLDARRSNRMRMSGRIVTPDGISIKDVRVSLTGDLNASFLTGRDGGFVFENLDPEGSYTLELDKNTLASNGLSATDLVIVRNHIIGRLPIEEQFTLLAGDANGDGNLSSTDLVQIRNLIIGRLEAFPNRQSWGFEPNTMEVNSAMADQDGNIELNVVGYKIGDVNLSANPKQ